MGEDALTTAVEYAFKAHEDLRRLQERGQLILGAGIAAAGLSIPIIYKSPDAGIALSESLLTFAFCWHMNLNAEVAAVAETRDFIAERVNEVTPLEIHGRQIDPMPFKVVGDAGRGYKGTILTGLLPLFILLGFAIFGALNAFGVVNWTGHEHVLPRLWSIVLFLTVTLLCVFAFVGAGTAVSRYREVTRERLWGIDIQYESDRPELTARIRNMVLRRDHQGYSKERAWKNPLGRPQRDLDGNMITGSDARL